MVRVMSLKKLKRRYVTPDGTRALRPVTREPMGSIGGSAARRRAREGPCKLGGLGISESGLDTPGSGSNTDICQVK